MDSFGEYLSRERELRGVTLEEIAKSSNISITYLRALENDNHEDLPADVIVKGFLGCYAASTGMDYNEVCLAYDSFVAKKMAAEHEISEEPINTPQKHFFKSFNVLAVIVSVFVFSLLVFYYVDKSEEPTSVIDSEEEITQDPEKIEGDRVKEEEKDIDIDKLIEGNIAIQPESKPTDVENFMEAEDATAQLQKEETADKKPLTSSPETQETETKKPETTVEDFLILSAKALEENAWLRVATDDNEPREALLLIGETARWKAKEKFVVTLGNVSQTIIKLNKKDIILPKTSTNILRNIVITLKSIKDQ